MCLSCLRMWWISRRLFISDLFLVLVGYHRMSGLKCSYCASREFLFVGLVLPTNSKGSIMIVMLDGFSITLYALIMSNSANRSLHEQLYLFKFCHLGLAPCRVPIHLIVVREENLGLVCNTPVVFHRTCKNLGNLKFCITRAQFMF